MKCINRKQRGVPHALKTGIPVMLACLMLSGCTNRNELADAYRIYDTSDSYQLTSSIVQNQVSLMAEDLCVGGTKKHCF